MEVKVEEEVEVEAKLPPYLTATSSSNTQPILVKFWILHLMMNPNKLYETRWLSGPGGRVKDKLEDKVELKLEMKIKMKLK